MHLAIRPDLDQRNGEAAGLNQGIGVVPREVSYAEARAMWRRCMSVCGFALVAAALPAPACDSIVIPYLGGSTRRGAIEDGRHFVEYKGHTTEVSESTSRSSSAPTASRSDEIPRVRYDGFEGGSP